MERQIRREHIGFIGGDHHLVVVGILRKDRQLTLHQNMARIGATRSAGVFELTFLGDASTEFLGSAAVSFSQSLIIRVRPVDQEPARPAFPQGKLRHRIGPHRAGWRDMQNVCAAFIVAQRNALGLRVEHHRPVLRSTVRQTGQIRVIRHQNDELDPVGQNSIQRGVGLFGRDRDCRCFIGVSKERAGGAVILIRQLRTGKPVVFREFFVTRNRRKPRGIDPQNSGLDFQSRQIHRHAAPH